MRIAVPSDDGVNIAAHTGRAQGFVIFDVLNQQAKRLEYRSNQYTPHAQGQCQGESETKQHQDHSHSHTELVDALSDCQIMIARGMGPRLVMDLARRNIEVVFCECDNADTAATLYAQGQLHSTGKSCCEHSG
ncbi:MAG: NifB/NifX family molybdenum-iron cluster-binding protein [bacterium]